MNLRRRVNFSALPSGLCLIVLCGTISCTAPSDLNKRVLLVHARGVSYSLLTEYLQSRNTKSYLKNSQSDGTLSKLHPITNAVTISNIASFETGHRSSEHGILGHNFGSFENGILKAVNGFLKRYEQETYWEKADRHGRRVLNIGALAIHGKYEAHENVDCLAQGTQTSQSKLLKLLPEISTGNQIIQYRVSNDEQITQDSSADPIQIYKKSAISPSLTIDTDLNFENGTIGELTEGDWLEINTGRKNNLNQSLRLKWTKSENDTIELYVRGSFVNRGYPAEFLSQVDSSVGPSKGWPNIPLYSSGQISEKVLIEEINAEMDYVMNVFSFSATQKEYDLIMVDYPLMDRYGHAFLQLKNSSSRYQQFYERAFDRMDKDFEQLSKFAAENNFELIIASGHGFSPIHSSINLNKVLQEGGIVTDLEKENWQARAIPGKVSSHIYINRELDDNQRKTVEGKISAILEKLTLTENGKIVTDKIYTKESLDEIGLLNDDAGDIFILLKPGYVFSSNEALPILSVPVFKGDHGYSLDHEESFGFLISDEDCNPCLTTDIAGIVTKNLKIK
ncbi:MAG: alkaline phosphatase family protein [Cyclobacteriaceae bacterium]